MSKTSLALAILITLAISSALGVQSINLAIANPISIPSVPTLQISYPLTSIGEYVNSTVEFEIYVNLFIESPTLNSISYSLDGDASVNLEDLTVTSFHDYGPEKIDFKHYKAHLILKDLAEGNHTLVAYANDMSAYRNFTVNSQYHVTALNVLSPNSPITSTIVPLTFTYTGEIENARYYLYTNQELIAEQPLSGNTTLENLSDGSYDLYLFVTTEYGPDSKALHFFVIGSYTVIATVILAFSSAIGITVYFKKLKRKN